MPPQRFIASLMAADEEINMDKDRVKGAAKNTTGKMKEGWEDDRRFQDASRR